jgi:3-oxoacyl-[acyl-carrier-protein] synthase III
MSGNHTQRHTNVGVLSVEAVEAPEIVTSAWIDEQLTDVFARCDVRPGLLEELAGIKQRRWWPESMRFDAAAALAGEKAIVAAGIDRSEIGMLISTSVCKHHLEPSVACAVHHHLGLAPGCLNFDLGNACLGFVNAIHLAATTIDAGQIPYALVVDAEGSRHTQLTTIARLQEHAQVTADVYDEFASLTLGSGAAAMVLGSLDRSPEAHRVVGGVSRAATQHHQICVGDLERMSTDTKALLEAGLLLAHEAWSESAPGFGWNDDVSWYVLHQVSSVHTSMLCATLGIDESRAPLTFPLQGNIGPASIPFTLAGFQDRISAGERVLCMGMGSGLNASVAEIIW